MPTDNIDADTDRLFQLHGPFLKEGVVDSLADDFLDLFQGSWGSPWYLSLVVWTAYGAFNLYILTTIMSFHSFLPMHQGDNPSRNPLGIIYHITVKNHIFGTKLAGLV